MKFTVDENLNLPVARLLRAAGHDALTVHEQGLASTVDAMLVRICAGEDRVLLTLDVGLGNPLTYPPGTHAGVVLLRLGKRTSEALGLIAVQSLLPKLPGHQASLSGEIWIVSPSSIRIYRGDSRS